MNMIDTGAAAVDDRLRGVSLGRGLHARVVIGRYTESLSPIISSSASTITSAAHEIFTRKDFPVLIDRPETDLSKIRPAGERAGEGAAEGDPAPGSAVVCGVPDAMTVSVQKRLS